ncbi:MAG: hypothetical protein ACYTFW_10300 [Planctomycetota bacterium]|jgi:hypothetical protein
MMHETLGEVAGMAMTGGASATLGACLSLIGKAVNFRQQATQQSHARDVEELKLILDSQDRASQRVKGKGGVWIRRFIVLALFGFMFGLLAINGIIANFVENGVPATYAYLEQTEPRFFGLLKGRQILRTVELTGIPVFSQAVNMMWLIGTFYFGSSRIK